MLTMEDRFYGHGDSPVVAGDDGGGSGEELEDGEHLMIDLDALIKILDDNSDPTQGSQEDQPPNNLSFEGDSAPYAGKLKETLSPNGSQVLDVTPCLEIDHLSYNSDGSDSKTRGSSGSFICDENLDQQVQIPSPAHTLSASFKDWFSIGQEVGCMEKVGVSHFEMPSCSTASSFEEDVTCSSDHGNNVVLNLMENDAGINFRRFEEGFHSRYRSNSPIKETSDVIREYSSAFSESRFGALQNSFPGILETSLVGADMSLANVSSTASTICQNYDLNHDFNHYSSISSCLNTGSSNFHTSNNPNFHPFSTNGGIISNMRGTIGEFPAENPCSDTRMSLNAHERRIMTSMSEVSVDDYPDVKGLNFRCAGASHASSIYGNSLFAADRFAEDKALPQQFSYNHQFNGGSHSLDMIDETIGTRSYYNAHGKLFVAEDSKQPLPGILSSFSSQMPMLHAQDEKVNMMTLCERASHFQDIVDENFSRSLVDSRHVNTYASEQYLPVDESSNQVGYATEKRDDKKLQFKGVDFHLSNVSPDSTLNKSLDCRFRTDGDPDVCIIEDVSQTVQTNQAVVLTRTCITPHQSVLNDSIPFSGGGGLRLKANDERLIFRAALQDLSQPKSEARPPDGVLAVPLLRHQRIALAWMVQKETGLHCSGGILADDQGLGKTVSTIALILKERPPSFKAFPRDARKGELETLNLDDDDDGGCGTSELNETKQESGCSQINKPNGSAPEGNFMGQGKGRPAAGTLIVCPTSVLRQWAEELQDKVTTKANLSVLVYHGSNRTKDPCQLAKYDVVLTTYSIVSMEVPKQPLADGDEGEKEKLEGESAALMGSSSNRKRKYPPSSDRRCSKHKKGVDTALLESIARPLAKVGWFRVVLDEAQSIKNHRTQVARACWGLRAKRRWCLSGTPIQNAIDDLYSYFRFLRYDPYAGYKSFCSTIKVPITRNPAKGYKKLQAVLKTVMLRRTKGTLLDGEPIISLPPKVVELKKVDFTKEERDFYSRLENDSRDQFKEYADAGTVKQNYVNILLMLLRLRQACDHPLLVKGYDSVSVWRPSVESAKKLSHEKQVYLLQCLEASLAICGICNDPPEDAVVSVCGHVFCKQCICEHLTGDDNQCPDTSCKSRLNMSSVFPKATLKSSLSEMPGQDYPGSELVETVEPSFEGGSYDSSKIKAALEVLQSLARPQNHIPPSNSLQDFHVNDVCPENSSECNAGAPLKDISDTKKLNVIKEVDALTKIVGEKAIVFSQWTRMLDLLEACLKNSSIQYRRLDGTMSVIARDRAVKDFNTLPEVSVMIMSLKAASLGLNMVAACHVLLLDLWWNPTTEDQAIDRAHRIGQTRPVTVLRLTVKDTVEDRILALQQKKREMVASAFGEDETGGRQSRLTVDDLKYLFMV